MTKPTLNKVVLDECAEVDIGIVEVVFDECVEVDIGIVASNLMNVLNLNFKSFLFAMANNIIKNIYNLNIFQRY